MCAIALHQQQYPTYVLSHETGRLEVVPQRGGIVTRWQVQGEDILYLDASRFANPDLSVRGGIPILFPICGNLPDNTYTDRGDRYSLKQHGFARDLVWEVVDEGTPNSVSITLVLNSNNETLKVYPYDFQLAFTYQILGNSLEIRQRYSNRSNVRMPFSTGFHPYFWTKDKDQLQFDIPATQFLDQIARTTHSFDGSFDFNCDEIDVAFRPLGGKYATVTDTSRQLRLSLNYDDTYSTLVFWTVKGKDFYCLEPWSAPRNALNTGENLLYLEPGDHLDAAIGMTATFF